MNIRISNLGNNITDESLRAIFATYGHVSSSTVLIDGFTGKVRGVGFVDMPDSIEGAAAIANLSGTVVDGCTLTVTEANPMVQHKGSYTPGKNTQK